MKRVVVLASLAGAGLAIAIAGTAQTPILAPAARIPIDAGPSAVAIGDVTADGHPDVVIGYSQARTVRVLTGDGKGGLRRVLPPMTLAYPPSELALADVNEDGRLDLGISDHGNYAIDILLNNGAGGFMPAAGSRFVASRAAGRIHTVLHWSMSIAIVTPTSSWATTKTIPSPCCWGTARAASGG
jgi:hypothetical protein